MKRTKKQAFDNQLIKGDCLKEIAKIPSHSVNAIITDPHYSLGMTTNGIQTNFTDLAICEPFYRQLFEQWKRVLNPTGEIYMFCDWRTVAFYMPIFQSVIGVKNMLVWNKGFGRVNQHYCFSHELILFGRGEQSTQRHCESNIIDIKGFSSRSKTEKIFATQKPLELIEYLLLKATQKGDLVLDCFVGSGTTAEACQKHDRRFIGFEIDEKTFELACRRLKNKTLDVFNF